MRRHAKARRYFPAAAACALAFALYAWDVPRNPPGFYIDESSIAYNAHAVSRTGADEYGEVFPLYFRAFGDYKNPVYVYTLAALFRLTGPSIMAARLLSATLGVLAALLLGLLAAGLTLTNRAAVGALAALSALLTPWLYESSRLVFEVAAYPLAVVLFLLALRRASAKERWTHVDVATLAATLALLTYTYSIGRLFAPLLALGLALFVTRRNLARVVQTWAVYALTLVPLVVFSLRNPGALTKRFGLITYLNPRSGIADGARVFALHYLADVNPARWLLTGEPNIRDHLPGAPALLAATVLLACVGLVIILLRHRREAWWRFQLYALAASVLPAALTVNDFPQLRLIAFPVFLHVLLTPAAAWMLEGGGRRRALLYLLAALVVAQGAHFQWLFHARAPERWYVFDARFPRKILAPALASVGGGVVYLQDPPGRSGYIQALWHGTLRGVESSRFVRLSPVEAPPPGAVVISTEETCADCRVLARSINYILYAVPPTDLHTTVSPLAPDAMRASVSCANIPASLDAGARARLDVLVRNTGGAEWPAVGDEEGCNSVRLRDRWLKPDGSVLTDEDASARIPFDMAPGDTAGLALTVNAPSVPGEYVLELDLVQEGVAWFGARGSQTFRANVKVFKAEARP
jgi:hypothetical protein